MKLRKGDKKWIKRQSKLRSKRNPNKVEKDDKNIYTQDR